jgi:hypothetical protein
MLTRFPAPRHPATASLAKASETPYLVAGGAIRLSLSSDLQGPAGEEASPRKGSRRRRLWELGHKCHCPIVGVCFSVHELRSHMARVMQISRSASDYTLHSSAVGACEARGPLSDLLHKVLEKRYALTIRLFAAARSRDALATLWQEALDSGSEIPAALWATWTHPACDKVLEQTVYADIHMLQHQIGSGTRAELKTLETLRQENTTLRGEVATLREEGRRLQREKADETRVLSAQIGRLQAELASRDAWGAGLLGQMECLRASLPDLKDRQALARRAQDAENRAQALTARAAELEAALERLRRQPPPEVAPSPAQPPAAEKAPHPEHLAGRCILCVGGRSGSVEAYRQLVESRGGRFLHHDGGLEESVQRIDGALAAADLVICQAGCISHNAYWRVKEQCKRSGKRCIYVKTAGVTSFARSVAEATAPEAADAD